MAFRRFAVVSPLGRGIAVGVAIGTGVAVGAGAAVGTKVGVAIERGVGFGLREVWVGRASKVAAIAALIVGPKSGVGADVGGLDDFGSICAVAVGLGVDVGTGIEVGVGFGLGPLAQATNTNVETASKPTVQAIRLWADCLSRLPIESPLIVLAGHDGRIVASGHRVCPRTRKSPPPPIVNQAGG